MAEYIDREAVYKRACRGCTRHGDEIGTCYHEEPCEELQSEFASAPAADVTPVRHGTWIPRLYGKRVMYCCSLCDSRQSGRPNYCPHCGAKMDGRLNHENLLSR